MKSTLLKASFVVFILTLISKVMGFLKSMIVASYFGANYATDAYYLTNGLISNIFYAMTMSLSVAFLPIYINIKTEEGVDKGKEYAGKALYNLGIISIMTSVLICIAAPIVIKVAAPSYDDNLYDKAVLYMQILSLGITFSLSTNMMQNLLNAEKIYGYASISSVLNSIILIMVVITFGKTSGIIALVIATPLSMLFQNIFLRIRCKQFIRYKVKNIFKDKNLKKLYKKSIPIFCSNMTIELNQLIDQMLLVSISEGAVTAVSYSALLFQFAAHILSMPISTITYTEISNASATKDFDTVRVMLKKALKGILLLGVPVSIVVFMIPEVIVSIVYGRGEFTLDAVLQTADGLKYYALCIIPYCIKQVFSKAFYSNGDTKTPMKISMMEVALNIASSIVLSRVFGIKGVVMGTALASTVFCVVLILVFNKKYIKLDINTERRDYIKMVVATIIVMFVGVHLNQVDFVDNIILRLVYFTCIIIGLFLLLLVMMKEQTLKTIIIKKVNDNRDGNGNINS